MIMGMLTIMIVTVVARVLRVIAGFLAPRRTPRDETSARGQSKK